MQRYVTLLLTLKRQLIVDHFVYYAVDIAVVGINTFSVSPHKNVESDRI